MDRIHRQRRPLRAAVTKISNQIETELNSDAPSNVQLRVKLQALDRAHTALAPMDVELLNLMLDDVAITDEEYDNEKEVVDDYENKITNVKILVDDFLHPIPNRPSSPATSVTSFNTTNAENKSHYKLANIELKKFNGDLTEWIGWWSQFEKVHQDDRLHITDKFQYLVQATEVDTRARRIVDGYPQSAENYPKVIESLKDRFGDTTMLTEVYVRKLLKLVIANVGKSKDNTGLANMYDELESNLRALESLGVTADQSAAFLYPMVESSLPKDLIQVWQRSPLSGYDGDETKSTEERLKSLMKFLKREVKGAERLAFVQDGLDSNQGHKNQNNQRNRSQSNKSANSSNVSTAAGLFSGQSPSCIFCDNGHASNECRNAQSMSLQVKRDKIREKRACFNCLRSGHRADMCKANIKCLVCSRKHQALMCPDIPVNQKQSQAVVSTKKSGEENSPQVQKAMTNQTCTREVLLQTLLVKVIGPKEDSRIVRLVFDNGSQRSYIKRDTVNRLQYQSVGEEWISQSLFGGSVTNSKKHYRFNVKLEDLAGDMQTQIEVIDEPVICGRISRVPKGPWIQELEKKNIHLSDVWSDSPEIEVLIGNDYYGQFQTGKIIQLQCGLTATETIFGWTLGGRLPKGQEEPNFAMTVISMISTSEESKVQDLWSLESLGITDPADHKSKKEKEDQAKQHFLQTVSRTSDGRYAVNLPWINGKQEIPSNRFAAEKRLTTATKKLQDAGKYELYDKIFKDWEEEGIIQEVSDNSHASPSHYLPHRPVFKLESATTPVRPVFDASCKMGRNPSLNDLLEKGPNLLEEIPSILLRFRMKNIGVISDIRKAFLMVEVKEDERDFLRFLWWEDASCKAIKIYRHNRVVFGVNCSPFLLGAVIEHHLDQVGEADKNAAQQLRRSLYVDNCVTSVDSYQEYEEFKSITTRIMADAKMELRQWECSSGWETGVSLRPQLRCGLVSNRTGTSSKNWSTVLGLRWNKDEDTLSCDFEEMPVPEKLSKRKILSYAHQIYDTIGFLAPSLLCPKMILQEAWAQKTGWDEELSDDIVTRFGNWTHDLKFIKDIQIPRQVINCDHRDVKEYQFHTFCDASKHAFAAAVFLRSVGPGVPYVQLLLAKARVAPLKKVSIPRLELLACLVGSRLTRIAKEKLDMVTTRSVFWSDSSTALSWIRRNNEWGTFVGNRVKEICISTNSEDWKFVPGTLNPADLPSRGCSFKELLESRWWEGPDWLKQNEDKWPKATEVINEDEVLVEKRKTPILQMLSVTEIPWYCKRYSSYLTNVRVVAWIMRFWNNLKKSKAQSQPVATRFREIKDVEELDPAEMESAKIKLFTMIQKECFPSKEDRICGLKVVRDEAGVIYVKSKLLHRDDTQQFRFPILLPSKHPFVEQLIRHEHDINGHAGTQFIMGKLREKYWVAQGRRVISNILRSCVICRRYSTKSPVVPEAPLPTNRVKSARVFETVGVDLAGPLFLKDGSKTWIVLFTCAVYRAVHLELVDSQSTDSFLLALTRFISRRGRPVTIYSDNGTNFVGACNLFRSLDWKKIQKTNLRHLQPLQWIFNPPSAAWWGGWWERLIRSVKDLLKRMLGNKKLSLWPLQTKLTEVEAIINGRPLTYITEDEDDLIPLTPAMFLQASSNSLCPEANAVDGDGLRKTCNQMKQLTLELQHRFRREYLAQLVHKGRNMKSHKFNCGDVVLIGDDNRKRLDWPLAKIVQLFPGKDGHVRAAKVKTSTGMLTRPLQRLYPLEVTSSSCPPIPDKVIKIAKKEKASRPTPKDEDRAVTSTPMFETPIVTRYGRQVKKPTYF